MVTTAVVVADPTKGMKVDAGIIAQPFRDEVKERVAQLRKHGIGAFCFRSSTSQCALAYTRASPGRALLLLCLLTCRR